MAQYNKSFCNFSTYADMETFFARVMSPKKGRPIKQGWRLYKEGSTFVVKMYDWSGGEMLPVLKVSPRNTATYLLPLERVLRNANSLVIMFPRIVPIHLARARKGVYRIGHEMGVPMRVTSWGTYPDYTFFRKEAPEYFRGIKFNLITGECLNAKPDTVTTELPEQRKVWRSELRRYKRGLKARAKVGALRGFIEAEQAAIKEAGNAWPYHRRVRPDWTDSKWTNLLVKNMKKEKYPAEILQAFVRSVDPIWHNQRITEKDVLRAVDQVFTRNSEHLRRKYGVFGKTLHMKS